MSSRKDINLRIKTPTNSGYTYRSFTNATKSTSLSNKHNSSENAKIKSIAKQCEKEQESVRIQSQTCFNENICRHSKHLSDNKSYQSIDNFSSQIKKITSVDFNREAKYLRDDYITYKNSYFNKYNTKNYNGYIETDAGKLKTLYRRDDSHDRIFPKASTEKEIAHIRVDVSKKLYYNHIILMLMISLLTISHPRKVQN